jgi:hypothetical protein
MKLKIYPVFQMTLRAPLIVQREWTDLLEHFLNMPLLYDLEKMLAPLLWRPWAAHRGAPGPSPPTPPASDGGLVTATYGPQAEL